MANDENPVEVIDNAKEVTALVSSGVSAAIENEAQTLLPPAEFSKIVYRELTFRRVPIRYKQIQQKNLEHVIKECANIADELFKRGYTDAKLLYRISGGNQEYSGASKESFSEIFASSSRPSFISIVVSAKFDQARRIHLLSLDFSAGISESFVSQVTASGDDEMWVKSTHALFTMVVSDFENANRFLYSSLTDFLVQISAVIVIFALSVASTTYTNQKIFPFSNVYMFAAVFLFGSNTWTYLSRTLTSWRTKYFPVVSFKGRKAETILLGIAGAVGLLILGWSVNTSLDFIKGKLANRNDAPATVMPRSNTQDVEKK